MTIANSYPVRYQLVELTEDHGPYRKGEMWADPSIEHASQLLREVYEDRVQRRPHLEERQRTAEAENRTARLDRPTHDRLPSSCLL